jgi:hypothetical protein
LKTPDHQFLQNASPDFRPDAFQRTPSSQWRPENYAPTPQRYQRSGYECHMNANPAAPRCSSRISAPVQVFASAALRHLARSPLLESRESDRRSSPWPLDVSRTSAPRYPCLDKERVRGVPHGARQALSFHSSRSKAAILLTAMVCEKRPGTVCRRGMAGGGRVLCVVVGSCFDP